MRPSLKVSDRAVLMPSTAISRSLKQAARSGPRKRSKGTGPAAIAQGRPQPFALAAAGHQQPPGARADLDLGKPHHVEIARRVDPAERGAQRQPDQAERTARPRDIDAELAGIERLAGAPRRPPPAGFVFADEQAGRAGVVLPPRRGGSQPPRPGRLPARERPPPPRPPPPQF